MAIGFELDDDGDECGCEGPMQVGEGHESVTPDESVDLATRLAIALDAVKKLREMGVTFIEVGDIKARFPERS